MTPVTASYTELASRLSELLALPMARTFSSKESIWPAKNFSLIMASILLPEEGATEVALGAWNCLLATGFLSLLAAAQTDDVKNKTKMSHPIRLATSFLDISTPFVFLLLNINENIFLPHYNCRP